MSRDRRSWPARALSAVLALLAGNGGRGSDRYTAAAGGGQLAAAPPAPVARADVDLTCPCGRSFATNLIGLERKAPPACPGCGQPVRITVDEMRALENHFIATLTDQFEDRGYRPPTKAALRTMRRTGQLPPGNAPRPATSYPAQIVGESHYQPAIGRCRTGEPVQLLHEPDNPFASDGRAVAVVSEREETIGYLPSDSWLKQPIFDEGRGVRAVIDGIGRGQGRTLGVLLRVSLRRGPIRTRPFRRD